MKAVVFHKPKDLRVDEVPDARIVDPRDAVVRVTSTAICGSDLHIYNGFFPQPKPMTLGHEFMGIVEEVGAEVTNLKRGDRVVVPFPIACGQCFFCEHELPTGCERSNPKHGPEGGLLEQKGGALFGYTDLYGGIAGGQAEAVRVPFADYGMRKVPRGHNPSLPSRSRKLDDSSRSSMRYANGRSARFVRPTTLTRSATASQF